MADNFLITQGSGTTIAADEVVDGTLGTVKVQYVKIMDGTLDGTSKASVSATGLKVDGSGVTQPVSGTVTTMPPANASVNLTQVGGSNIFKAQQTMANSFPVAISSDQSAVSVLPPSATLLISTTAATGVAVTATLPAVASNFHYITLIEITKYFTAANAASATPLVITTTNLPGPLAITFAQPLGTIGTVDNRIYMQTSPLKSLVVNTATTVVCPATVGIIWRVNVWYYAGV